MSFEKKTSKIIKAGRMLQSKVGTGTVDQKKIEKSQSLIDQGTADFKPLAEDYLNRLEIAIDNAEQKTKEDADLIQDLIEPVMQIKANAAMFDYRLVSNLASIMLDFLETIKMVDEDVIKINIAHRNMARLIVNNAMKGSGGEYGQELTTELKQACKRYFAKRVNNTDNTEDIEKDRDAFFVDG